MIKVSSTNFYVGNKQPVKDAEFLASLNCAIGGIQEGHGGNAVDIKRTLKRTHDVYWGNSKNKERDLAYLDVPVVFKKNLKVMKSWSRIVSKRAQVENIGMARAATAVRFEYQGQTYTFINTHLNAAVQSKATKKPLSRSVKRVYEYIRSIIVLESMIKNAQKRGDIVILVGDLNYSPVKEGIWRYSPQALFKRTKLDYRAHHIDYIAFTKGLKVKNFTIIPKARTGADHDWLTLELH